MIVALLQASVVVSPKTLIFKLPTHDNKKNTIPSRLKACQNNAQIIHNTPDKTIADRVTRRQLTAATNQANPVLDQKTKTLLKYCQLLSHPKYKEA